MHSCRPLLAPQPSAPHLAPLFRVYFEGTFGNYHFGIIRTLLREGLLPRVVSGSSAGSIGSALLATRTDEELHALIDAFPTHPNLDFMSNSSLGPILRNLLQKGERVAAQRSAAQRSLDSV
jgi:predicted acylesterase/phospholipase RssA